MEHGLELDGLHCSVAGASVGPVDLFVPAGRCVAIGGASGAGKSLLLRMIADLVPNEGRVRFGALARADLPAHAWRRQVMYAGGAGWWAETVAAHFPLETHAEARARIARLGLDADYLERPVATLSTGEAQRLCLVRALVRAPKVLLLDEPTSGLDADSTARVEDLLRAEVAQGLTLLLVSHDTASALRLAERRYLMAAGRLAAA